MNSDSAYVSSIPAEAMEAAPTEPSGDAGRRVQYFLDGACVGERSFYPSGELEWEDACREGRRHGWQYRWDQPGRLSAAEPYENGVLHGTAFQWGRGGKLLGTYTLEHGTGFDLWREEDADGTIWLSEVHAMRDGLPHGFEWWLNPDQRSVHAERHWHRGEWHGIEREWNVKGRLRRGYPRYWIQGRRVPKAQYLKAAAQDPSLPPFQPEDNAPQRTFPAGVAEHLAARSSVGRTGCRRWRGSDGFRNGPCTDVSSDSGGRASGDAPT